MRTDYTLHLPMESASILTRVFDSSPFQVGSELADLAFLDENSLATIEEDGLFKRWDLEKGIVLGQHEIEPMVPLWRFCPEGKLLAGGSNALHVYPVPTGNPGWASLPTPWLTAVAFSPKVGVIACGDEEGWVRLWNSPAKEPATKAQVTKNGISALAFSPCGTRVAAAAEDCQIYLLDSTTLKQEVKISGHKDRVTALAWSPDGKTLYSSGWDTTVRVWDTATGKAKLLVNTHAVQVLTLALSADGKKLASADSDFLVRVWDTHNFQEVVSATESAEEVSRLAFSPSGKTLAVAGKQRFEILHLGKHPREGPEKRISELHCKVATGASGVLACLTPGEYIDIWDFQNGNKLPPLRDAGPLQAFALSPDGKNLAASINLHPGGNEKTPSMAALGIWSTNSMQLLKILDNTQKSPTAIAFSPMGDRLAWGSILAGEAHIREVDSGNALGFFPEAAGGFSITAVDFLKDGSAFLAAGVDWMATSRGDGKVVCWDIASRMPLKEWNYGATHLAVSPDGAFLALARTGNHLELWDILSWEKLSECKEIQHRVTALAFSPCAGFFAASGEDQRVRFFTAPQAKHLGTLDVEFKIAGLAFSSSGNDLFLLAPGGKCNQYDVKQFLNL